MSVITSFLSDCARRGRWSRGLIALQGMSVELETNSLIQQAALKYALSAAKPHPEISLSLLRPTYIFSHTKLVCELAEILSHNKRVHCSIKGQLSSSSSLLNLEDLEQKYFTFLLESMELCRATYSKESHEQSLKRREAVAEENLESCLITIATRNGKCDEVLCNNTCEERNRVVISSLMIAPEMKCISSENISTHETEVQNALFISGTHWCNWSIAQWLYKQLICPSDASKQQFQLLYNFAQETWQECGSFSWYIQKIDALEQSRERDSSKDCFQEEMESLNTAHNNSVNICTTFDERVSSAYLSSEPTETKEETSVIDNNKIKTVSRRRKSAATLQLERLRREEEIKQKYVYLCQLITLGLSNSPSVVSCAFLLRCATRPVNSTRSNTQSIMKNNVCSDDEDNTILSNLPKITLRIALSSVESHYMTNELMLWYIRCIGLCAPHLAHLVLETVQFDERVAQKRNNFLKCDAIQNSNNITENKKCNGKDKRWKKQAEINKCTWEHNEHAVNKDANSLSLMLIKLWLLSRSNWQAASLYLNELREILNNSTARVTHISIVNKTERVDKFVIRNSNYISSNKNNNDNSVDLDVADNITNTLEMSATEPHNKNNNNNNSCDQNKEEIERSKKEQKLELNSVWSVEEQHLFWECAEDIVTRTAMPRSVFFTHFPHKGQPSVKLIVQTRRGVAHALAHGWRIEKVELSRLCKHWSTNSHWREMLYLYRRIPTPEFQKRLVHVLLRLRLSIAELDDTFQRELAASCEENSGTASHNSNNYNKQNKSMETIIVAEHIITLICGPKGNVLAPCAGSMVALIASCEPSDWVRALQLFRHCIRAGGVCTPIILSTIMNTNIPTQELEILLTNYSSAVNNGIRRRAQ